MTVAQLTELLITRQLSAVALARACLDRIAALDERGPALHAERALNPGASPTRRRPTSGCSRVTTAR
ncbi:hypothetical protein QRX50_40980 [Amycolatopsis carbonis]|uniref:Amidase n=1 Tax=Amycolatopsis carbonis TaxID=715471 RepID=A0A9Y2IEA4_9PSEU|nr:hypothetical protein [Amycolatopsis sp. 2-15]WIX77716.1 hypothetical protein QRX50_40980 [Amycolatopsis sp. 2-15]